MTSRVQRMLPQKWPRMRMTKHDRCNPNPEGRRVPRNICTTAVKHVGTTDDTFQACVVATLQQWYYCGKSNIKAKHCGCKAGVAIVQLKHQVAKQARMRKVQRQVCIHLCHRFASTCDIMRAENVAKEVATHAHDKTRDRCNPNLGGSKKHLHDSRETCRHDR